MLKDKRSLDVMVRGSVVRNVRRLLGSQLQRTLHGRLVQVMPVGAPVHVVLPADLHPVGVDGVVGLFGGRGQPDGAVVGPGADFHRGRAGDADDGVLGPERRDGVVHVVFGVFVVDVGGLCASISLGLGAFEGWAGHTQRLVLPGWSMDEPLGSA